MGSYSIANDRLELVEYLLTRGDPVRTAYVERSKDYARSMLPGIIEEAFQVYQEIPLDVIRRKLEIKYYELDNMELLLLLEEMILDGMIQAKIRGSDLVKY